MLDKLKLGLPLGTGDGATPGPLPVNTTTSNCKFGWGAVGVGGAATLCSALVSIPFLSLQPGAEIRPMMWAGIQLVTAAASLVSGLLMSATSLRYEKPKWPALLGMALCLGPFPAGILVFKIAEATLGIKMIH
ncbi:MAG: hypothetical protein O3C21_09185 [Verrucomicrobia bacterium]|nr:hypothetical protein [Verrucomicrobiota bacterium]